MGRRRYLGFGDVHEDDGGGLGGGAGGIPAVPAGAGSKGEGRPSVSRGSALLCGAQHHLPSAAGAVRALELDMEEVPPAEPGGSVRRLFRHAGGFERHGASGSGVRFHCDARACLGSGRKRGQHGQALGRSRGGFGTRTGQYSTQNLGQFSTQFNTVREARRLQGRASSRTRRADLPRPVDAGHVLARLVSPNDSGIAGLAR